MNELPSVRRRLSRLLIAVALVWGLAVSVVVWVALAHEVDELLDGTLRGSAEALVGLIEPSLAALPQSLPAAAVADPEEEHFAWQLLDPQGRVLLHSSRAPATALLPLPVAGFVDAPQWRVFGQRFARSGHILYVAQTREERVEARVEVALVSVLAALAVGLASAGWLRTRIDKELQPLADSTRALQAYSPLLPGAVLQGATRAELAPMHAAIEDLGQRLAQRVANERAFSAHAAHALRTPLAGIDAQLAVAMREAPPELAPRLARVRQATDRLTRVVTALLALFRSGVELHWRRIEIAPLLARLPLEGLVLRAAPGAELWADADLLTAALLNLLDNSLRHGATQAEVSVLADAQGPVLRVHDNGRGFQPGQRAALQTALDTQRYEGGTGLGLMLADMVARSHGGALRLPEVPGGCRVEMQLGHPPAAPV